MPPVSVTKQNLFEVLVKENTKTALVTSHPQPHLVTGNVSVDHSGNLDKYLSSDHQLIFSEFLEILHNTRYENRDTHLSETLKTWDQKLKNLILEASPNTGFVLLCGEGDIGRAN